MLSEPTNETKRNSGRTGATSEAGRATSARNATRHGMCATTLILEHELESDWQDLLQTWLKAYQSPAESTLLYTFVLKTAQSEWHRLRVQPNAASSANTASSNTTGKHTANQSPHGRPPPKSKPKPENPPPHKTATTRRPRRVGNRYQSPAKGPGRPAASVTFTRSPSSTPKRFLQ